MFAPYYTMTFDELMTKQAEITKKYNAAYSAGASQEVMNQMYAHMEAIKHAMWELGYKRKMDSDKDSDPFKDSIIN